MPANLETRDHVKKRLEDQRGEHMHHLLVALGKSPPDLAQIDAQDTFIQRIDRALEWLKHYPPQGYDLEEEPASSPRVIDRMKKLMPKITLPKAPAPKTAEPTEG